MLQGFTGDAIRWWTGEDSNLRSPQGAADLQSAGFSHSPTRPHGGNHNSIQVRSTLSFETFSVKVKVELTPEKATALSRKQETQFPQLRDAEIRLPKKIA